MIIKKITGLLLLTAIILHSCVDAYDAETDAPDPVLVVEGLVSTELKHHLVKLSRTTPFDAVYRFEPESNASLYVEDSEQQIYHFSENTPGHYYSNEAFRGVTGHSYTLHIETENGDVFRSEPQTIMPTIGIDTLSTRMVTRQKMLPNNDGELVLTDIPGVEVFAEIENYDESAPKFRFEQVVYVQYITVINPEDPDSPLDFCHLKVDMQDLINITVPATGSLSGNTIVHEVAFIPVERKYYPGLYIQHTRLNRRALILKQYSLNENAFLFYKQLSGQLEADGNLFDPIAVQLYGNISCLNDPEKLALGFFEASGYRSETFAFPGEPLLSYRVSLKKVDNLDHLPRQACSYDIRPPYWLY